jgi:hypothetical protein
MSYYNGLLPADHVLHRSEVLVSKAKVSDHDKKSEVIAKIFFELSQQVATIPGYRVVMHAYALGVDAKLDVAVLDFEWRVIVGVDYCHISDTGTLHKQTERALGWLATQAERKDFSLVACVGSNDWRGATKTAMDLVTAHASRAGALVESCPAGMPDEVRKAWATEMNSKDRADILAAVRDGTIRDFLWKLGIEMDQPLG